MTPEQRRIGVPLVIIAAQWRNPPGWSDEATERLRKYWREGQDEIAARSPKSKIIFTAAGHEVPLEAPDVIVKEIRAMAREVW